jgi:regulator of sirC expression with transglutaminase-like and TPR domain
LNQDRPCHSTIEYIQQGFVYQSIEYYQDSSYRSSTVVAEVSSGTIALAVILLLAGSAGFAYM